ncbi:MAG: type II toxin-antitoxin system CcdA family antitoxin [Methanolinea sp.]
MVTTIDQGGKLYKNTSVTLPFNVYALSKEQGLNFSKTLTEALIRELRKKGIVFEAIPS